MHIFAIMILLLPLFSALVNGLLCRYITDRKASIVAITAMSFSAILACSLFYDAGIKGNIQHLVVCEWVNIGGLSANWAIYVDQLSSIMFIIITFVSLIVHIYSLGYMSHEKNLPKFLCFLSFFTFFMLALVSADGFLQLFFGWEGVGLCSYLLIGYWYDKDSANKAAVKAFVTNRVSDFAFILGIVMIMIYTEAVDFKTVFSKSADLHATIDIGQFKFVALDVVCLLLFIGCMGKSAQLGLHVWLPDAMEGPTPVSALIHAATMVTAGVFLLARCSHLFEYSPVILQFIAITGAVTCLFAASIAIAQTDIKKIIAYSTCSQLGYMFLACGVSAYQAGIFHLVTHAFFKALLFLCAGNVIHACHEQDIFKMGGLRKKMPITYCYFIIGSIAIVGIFPLAGFYSKDMILESVYNAGEMGKLLFAVGIITAMLTAIYSSKIIMLVFHGSTNLPQNTWKYVHEAELVMNIPLIILAMGSIFAGLVGYYMLDIVSISGYFAGSIHNINENSHHNIPLLIKILPLITGVVGVMFGTYLYKNKLNNEIAGRFEFVNHILNNKYYIDELYNFIFVRPVHFLAKISELFDRNIIDYFGPGSAAWLTRNFGFMVSQFQTGYIVNYAFVIILSIIMCVTYLVSKEVLYMIKVF